MATESFDALPYFFVAPVVGGRYALFHTAAQIIPEQNFMYVSVISSDWTGGIAHASTYCQYKIRQKGHTRLEGSPIIRDAYFQVEGVEVLLNNGPTRSAELLTFFGREAEILPNVPNQNTFELTITPGIHSRRFPIPIAPQWVPPVAAPLATAAAPANLPVAAPLPAPLRVEIPPPPADVELPPAEENSPGLVIPPPAPRNRYRPRAPTPPTPPSGLPAHVKAILIEVAVSKGDSCPISMNPITKENAAVTSCGHVFDRDSIAQWLASSDRHGCPNCREHCVV